VTLDSGSEAPPDEVDPAGASTPSGLSAQLVDLVTEAVAQPQDGVHRAEVIVTVVDRMIEAVRWRLEPDGDLAEEAGLAAIRSAAVQHHCAMALRASDQGSGDGRAARIG
jgi:uncharacterized heparinase superfamily protein